jgi:hypothetical protein
MYEPKTHIAFDERADGHSAGLPAGRVHIDADIQDPGSSDPASSTCSFPVVAASEPPAGPGSGSTKKSTAALCFGAPATHTLKPLSVHLTA